MSRLRDGLEALVTRSERSAEVEGFPPSVSTHDLRKLLDATRRKPVLDLLLGPRCPQCTQRVFPRDEALHRQDCPKGVVDEGA